MKIYLLMAQTADYEGDFLSPLQAYNDIDDANFVSEYCNTLLKNLSDNFTKENEENTLSELRKYDNGIKYICSELSYLVQEIELYDQIIV